MNNTPFRDRAALSLFVLASLAALVFLPSFPARDLWNPDEPRYLEVGREMLMRGQFIVPHLNNHVYSEKPPLFFWCAAFFYRLGLGNNAGRFVAGLAMTATLLMVYLFARRQWKPPAPFIAGLATLVTVLFVFNTKIGVIDPLVSCLVVAAIMSGFNAMHGVTRRACGAWWLACYACMGLAILTKGHVGLIVPGLVILVYGIWNRRHAAGGGWIHLAGAILMLAIVAAWLIPAGIVTRTEDPGYLSRITIHQLTDRAVNSYSHKEPFYFYAREYLTFAFPWTLLFPVAVIAAVAAWRARREPVDLFLLIWFFGVFIMFSLFSGKRLGYVLPLAPALGLLMGRYLGQGWREDWPHPKAHARLLATTLAIAAVGSLLLAVAMAVVIASPGVLLHLLPKYREEIREALASLSPLVKASAVVVPAAAAGVALWGIRLMRSSNRLAAPATLAGLVLAFSLFTDLAAMPVMNKYKTGKEFCDAARPYLARSKDAFLFYNDLSGVYNLYTGRLSLPVLPDKDALRRELGKPVTVAVIGEEDMFRKLDPDALTHYWIATQHRVGHRNMLLVTNWNPATPAPDEKP